jgi:alkanesulfonate monooxygenase SsuD/methylene tetrahydromethanopterin reductase-like flavin-dependent oxidoreductase (luciferase family)
MLRHTVQRSDEMRFGWLTLGHSPSPEEDFAAIEQQLEQACFAEKVGFDSVWLTEHNFTGESVYSDPIPFASALAMRTDKVRIGFAVIQMSLRQPVRLATQLALLDNLCKGRLDVGVGRGTIFNEYEFIGYGLRSDDSRERMQEGLDVLLKAWSGEPVNHKGEHFEAVFPELRPRPFQRPHPPVWHSAVAPASFEACGKRGVPIMTLRLSIPQLKERLGLYERGLAESGLPEEQQKKLRRDAAVWRHIYVAESDAQAEDELSAALLAGRHHMNHARAAFNPPDFEVDPNLLNPWSNSKVPDDEALAFFLSGSALYGTPDRVRGQLEELRDAGVHHILGQMSFGYMSHDNIMQSMKRFGDKVIPAFAGTA